MRRVRFLIFILFIVACQNRGIYEESKNKVASSSRGAVSTAHPLATKSAVKNYQKKMEEIQLDFLAHIPRQMIDLSKLSA